jgi:hypothetical protein
VRKLTVVVRTAQGALPLLVAAGIGLDSSCGGGEEPDSSAADHGDASSEVLGTGGSGLGVGGATGLAGTLIGVGGPNPNACNTFNVAIPPEGVPALPGQICAAVVDPVDSARSARITLATLSPSDLRKATGLVEMAPDILALVVGLPTVEVVDATRAPMLEMQVSNMVKEARGFSFDASWPDMTNLALDRMTVRTTFEVACDGDSGTAEAGTTRLVHAVNDIFLCNGRSSSDFMWVSSGDKCTTVCDIIAEMAPSPIVPDKGPDDLPLARVLRLRIIALAHVSNAVILLAENDGGAGLDYEWHASGGHVERLAPDVVVWTVQQGMPAAHIQAAVFGPSAAAVASWGFNEAS